MRKNNIAFLIAFISPLFAFTQTVAEKVDHFIRTEMKVKDIPGLSFAVIKNNKIVQIKSYGFANLDHQIPVISQSVFPIASMDKQLIGTCIMRLYEQGKLKLDDRVSKYLDSIPSSWSDIQIYHLLSHTSGLPNETLENANGKGFSNYTSEDIYKHILKQNLEHPTGEKFLYSDAGFFLLQHVFEKASGQYYPAYIKDSVFIPLRMFQSRTLDPTEIVKGRVVCYYKNREGVLKVNNFRQINMGPHFSDIGTSVEDLVKYMQAIDNNRLLKRSSYDLMWTPAKASNGRQISELVDEEDLVDASASYGYGWELDSLYGKKIVYHAGFTGTSMLKIPEDNLSVILLTNLTSLPFFSPNAMAKKIASFYMSDTNKKRIPTSKVNAQTPEKILTLLAQDKPDSSFFDSSYYQYLVPAAKRYQRIIARYGKMEKISSLYFTTDNQSSIQTFETRYPAGTLTYHVTTNAKGLITFINIEKN